MRHFYVYVIGPDSGFPCKVGVAIDPRKRLCSLQTASWEDLYIYSAEWMPTRGIAYKIERLVKNRLKAHCIRGEWFNVLASDLTKEVKNIQIELEKFHAAETALKEQGELESYYVQSVVDN
jgi:hypothetical protein